MLNSKRFLDAFTSIEHYLRNRVGGERYITFYQLVDNVSKSDSTVKSFEKDLKKYADLRNAIVHERAGGYVIAEPNEQAVNDIERIASLLLKPPELIPLFQTKVVTLFASDPIAAAVKLMWDQSLSQIPIWEGERFSSLLTTNTVARWLGACVDEEVFSLQETVIAEVLRYIEDEDIYVFARRKATVFEALELFSSYESKGKRLEALLITEHGQPSETVIGIMTVSDLPKALKEIRERPV